MQEFAHDREVTPLKMMMLAFLAVMTVATSFVAAPRKAGAVDATGPVIVNASDSYGAGNGAGIYFETKCFTSPENFAHIYARQADGTVGAEVSCGGNVISQVKDSVEQSGWIAENGDTVDVVFVSMGGNDASFSDVVTNCFAGELWDPSDDPIRNTIRKCNKQLDRAESKIDRREIQTASRDTLQTIRDKMPNAKIVLVGYPHLHVDDGEVARRVRTLLDRFYAQQQELINEGNAQDPGKWILVDRRPLFAGHEVGAADEWIYNLKHLKIEQGDPILFNETYHPKPIGWQATAGLIAGLPGLSDLKFSERAKGSIVKIENTTESWLVDDAGVRHKLEDGGAFECAYASNGQRLIIASAALVRSLPLGDPAKPECGRLQDLVNNVVVDQANTAWWTYSSFATGYGRREIPTEASFRCLVNGEGHEVRRGVLHTDLNRFAKSTGAPIHCLDANEVDGKILVDPDTNNSYLFFKDKSKKNTAFRLRIRTTQTFACLEQSFGPAQRGYTHGDIMQSVNVVEGDDAKECLDWQNYVGKILRNPDGRSVHVTGNGQRGIRDGGTFRCFTEWKGAQVVDLNHALFNSVPASPDGWASCKTGVADGTIVRNSDTGWSGRKYTGSDGVEFLAHIKTSETYRCLTGKGVPVVNVSQAKIEAFLVGNTPEAECANPMTYTGFIVRVGHGSIQHYVDGAGTAHAITTGGTSLCLSLWAGKPTHPEVLTAGQIAQFTKGASATCSAHVDQAKGKIVKATSGGHAIYVDIAGTAHNIETSNAYACLVESGTAVMTVPNHEWQQAFSYGPDQPGCTKLLKTDTGRTYRELSDGRVLSVVDTQSYYCYADRLPAYRIVNVSQSVVDQMGVDGDAARCLSMSRYENKIVRDSNGRAGLVVGGVWRHIPDGHSWSCYRGRGHVVAENSVHPAHIDSAPKGSRMAYCLNPASFTNTMIRRSDGTVFKTNGSACRYHVGNGWTYNALAERGYRVVADNLNTEHTGSLPYCGTHQWMFSKGDFKNTLIRRASDGAVFWVNGSGCRYYVRDHYTLERRDEQGYGRKHWSAADSEIASLPGCGNNPLMLAKHRVENHVVRGPDGTSWLVRGGEWFWIDSGSKWNYLVNRYGLAPGTYSYTWEHIDSIKYDRGRWAGWW